MAHFTTDKVIVFPSAYRGQNASSASKYTSEQNITNLIKSMISNDDGSFVVGYTSSGVLKVIISGYYFEITISDISSYDNLWLWIKLNANYLVNTDNDTINLDVSGDFTGLAYSDTEPSSYSYKLQVKKDGKFVNNGYIKELSDGDGNWINVETLNKIADLLTPDGLIDPNKIDWDELSDILPIFVTGATKLVKDDKSALSVGSQILPVFFNANGIPQRMTTSNIGSNTSVNATPIYFDGFSSTPGFKPMTTTVGGDNDAGTVGTAPIWLSNGKFTTLSGPIGASNNPVYIDSTGHVTPMSGNIGGYTGSNLIYTSTHISNGVITAGQKITISTSPPTSTTSGNKGDIWFRVVS